MEVERTKHSHKLKENAFDMPLNRFGSKQPHEGAYATKMNEKSRSDIVLFLVLSQWNLKPLALPLLELFHFHLHRL